MRSVSLPAFHLVLAGGGHSHALLLRAWAREGAPAEALITLVSRSSSTLYSGMVPGLIAGLYAREACSIDLRRLCALAGVSFVCAEITGLDLARRELQLAGRPPLRWDRLSLDVGAVSAPASAPASASSGPASSAPADDSATAGRRGPLPDLAIKPLEPFLDWCAAWGPAGQPSGSRPSGGQPTAPAALTVLGGGAAGVEVALALRARFGRGTEVTIAPRPSGLQLGSAAANRCGERLLAAAGIAIGTRPGARRLLCTGSRAPTWLAAAGLPSDPASGRILTTPTLQVEGQPAIFASGDCGLIGAAPRPPSGVWAVRAAPLLNRNLRRSLSPGGPPLRRWHPQRHALQLLGAGAGASAGQPRAVAFWGPLALGPSRWLWRWKAGLDRRFMVGFTDLAPMAGGGEPAAVMPCRGCAAKLPAAPLSRALARLAGLGAGADPIAAGEEPQPARGPEDAQPLGRTATGGLLLQSLDGFPALVDDPWLNGRLTTLHACSDLWACGARVESAQALVTLPRAAEPLQEELLLQTLAGVRSVLAELGAELLGGHTLQQLQPGGGLSLALTVNGSTPAGRFWAKGGLRAGDALILTRPIGTGVLFAAAMAGAARPHWIDGSLAVMQQSQAPLVERLAAHGCRACTDITGFGLLGHLGEMLGATAASQALAIDLEAAAIPPLPGVWELLAGGWASSLAPSNRRALNWLDRGVVRLPVDTSERAGSLLRELLIDPQTCGPLLAALPAERTAAALADLRAGGFHQAARIGRVRAKRGG